MVGDAYDDSLEYYFRQINEIPLLTPKEEKQLAKRIKKGDQEARNRMIQANLRLVVKIAHEYSRYGMPLVDLVSEGNLGLMKAVDRFDPDKGGKLSTYAAWWIRQSIKRALANQGKTIRLPVHLVDKIARMRRVAMQLAEELDREPTDEELAEELFTTPQKIAKLRMATMRPSSLDAALTQESDSATLGDILADESVKDPSYDLVMDNLKDRLAEILPKLDPREQKILKLRFGLGTQDGKEMTLEEIGKKFNVTRERIRQLQKIALEKLRKILEEEKTK
ncbi:MAG: RNA polymerase sigma factor RpoD/SigA [Methylacidiphilales bacterium]|nr:RNA polymerase sigma factor RpoD/SigA [Candidatus Methylacidiphilales bacterium]MDW8349972.1 RNA polymerase sigma factor RpoD/SigA [Verrucomicrobiae bacterium]